MKLVGFTGTNVYISLVCISLVPRPYPTNQERGLVSLAKISVKIPVCAESAYYTTPPNNHIPYIIDSLRSSRASALRNVITGNG